MSPKNIVRLKIIYCAVWLAYPFWLGTIVQSALWGGLLGLGFLGGEGGRMSAAMLSAGLLIINIFLGLMLPASSIADNTIFYNGPTWGNLMDMLQKLYDLKQAEIQKAKIKRAREIEEAVRLAQEIRR